MGVDTDSKCAEAKIEKEPKSVEDVLEKIGGFSWFQVCVSLILLLPEIPVAMIVMSPLLTGSTTLNYENYECVNSPAVNVSKENFCSILSNCSETSYDSTLPYTSIVQEWKLYCERDWIANMITSVQMAGCTIGALTFPQLADRFGRRILFFAVCFLMGITGVAAGFAPNVAVFGFLRLLSGLSVGGLYMIYLNYLMEFLVPSARMACGCVTFWAVGEMILALIGYCLPAWRDLSIAIALPLLLVPLAIPWLPESPRWLLCHNRISEAKDVFNKIAHWNGREGVTLPQVQSVHARIHFQNAKAAEAIFTKDDSTNRHKRSWKSLEVFSVFEHGSYRRQFLVLSLLWFSMNLLYYGLSFNTKNLAGDSYLNILFMGLSELPGPFSGLFFSNRFGRKRTMIGFLSISAVLLTILATLQVMPPNIIGIQSKVSDAVKCLALAGRYCNAAGFAVMACATAESFPTSVRLTYAGVCGFFGNIGGILAPQLVLLTTVHSGCPYIIFSLLSIFVIILCLCLKETAEHPLNDVVNNT